MYEPACLQLNCTIKLGMVYYKNVCPSIILKLAMPLSPCCMHGSLAFGCLLLCKDALCKFRIVLLMPLHQLGAGYAPVSHILQLSQLGYVVYVQQQNYKLVNVTPMHYISQHEHTLTSALDLQNNISCLHFTYIKLIMLCIFNNNYQ